MRRAQLPISALPAWTKLNDVVFYDITLQDLGPKGFGFIADRPMSSEDTFDIPTLLSVPRDLVLSAEAVGEHAKIDRDFRELLCAAGGVSTRGDILLFLLMQLTITSSSDPPNIGVSNPWTEYIRMLPSAVPVPTTWTEDERKLLIGSSLESALSAKMSALLKEFERVRERTIEIPWCQKVWWDSDLLTLSDWVLLDSWYRSRCLELPGAGECMVPCLDMVNHGAGANSYYEQATNGDIILLLRPGQKVDTGQELTISYGSTKSAAEILFSYGFVDEHPLTNSLALDLHPFPDDPLGKAKAAVFSGAPVVRISAEGEAIDWSSPFLYLICLNEEDGLEFKVLQQRDGSQGHLQVFWQDHDVTHYTEQFQKHISQHPMRDVFTLRAVALLQDRLHQQLERIYACQEISAALEFTTRGLNKSFWTAASQLRLLETALLEKAFGALDSQKSTLAESPAVVEYLGTIGRARNDPCADTDITNDEDFS